MKVQKSKCAVFILASVQVCKVHRCKVHGGVFFFFFFRPFLFFLFFLFWLVGFLPLVRAVETRLFLYWLASRCANGAFFGWVASTTAPKWKSKANTQGGSLLDMHDCLLEPFWLGISQSWKISFDSFVEKSDRCVADIPPLLGRVMDSSFEIMNNDGLSQNG